MTDSNQEAIARPGDRPELERLLMLYVRRRFALEHAIVRQDGEPLDLLVRDPRAGDERNLWLFQVAASDARARDPAWLDDLVAVAATSTGRARADYLIAVTAIDAPASLHEHAHALTARSRATVEVWDWPVFRQKLIEVLGVGPWLDVETRACTRRVYCQQIVEQFERAPVTMPLFSGAGKELGTVWQPRRIRILKSAEGLDDTSMADAHEHLSDLLAALVSAPAARPHVVALLGEAGTGKTATLMHNARSMARAALADLDHPLPVRIAADRLVEMVGNDLPITDGDDATMLWRDPVSDWIVFIDGYDDGYDDTEEDRHDRLLRALARTLKHPRVRIVIVAMRPGARAHTLPQRTVHTVLIPWSSETPGQQLGLMEQLVDRALPDWDAEMRAALERLAWDGLRANRLRWSRRRLRDELQSAVPEEPERVDTALADPDVFRALPDGDLRMQDRRVVETLASSELARKPDAELLAAASFTHTQQVARLALLRRIRHDPEQLERLVLMLLRRRKSRLSGAGLRRLILLTQAIADLGEFATPVAKRFARLLVRNACHPASAWIRKIAGDLLYDLSRAGGPAWQEARAQISANLALPGDRAAWFETQAAQSKNFEDTPGYWSRVLLDESPRVRIIALQRLARWRDIPAVQDTLLSCVDDGGGQGELAWPSFHAGLALRGCQRTKSFREILDELRDALHNGTATAATAAALALLPGEAPAAYLLESIVDSWPLLNDLKDELANIVQPLLDTSKGHRWAAKNWFQDPDSGLDDQLDRLAGGHQLMSDRTPHPPLSRSVRRELAGTAARAFAVHTSARLLWRSLPPAARREPRVLDELCTAYRDRPAEMSDLLRAVREESPDVYWPPRAQDVLGNTALRDPELAESIVASWRPQAPGSFFPGLALEPLIAQGHVQAAQIYAKWLPRSPFVEMVSPDYRPITRSALQNPILRESALRRVRRLWREATEGRTNERGEFKRLHPWALGGVLRAMAPVWHDERDIHAGLIERAAGTRASAEDRELWLQTALQAWSDDDMPVDLIEMLARRFSSSPSNLGLRMKAAHRLGIVGRIEGDLTAVLSAGGEHAFMAASLLAEHQPLRAFRISKRAAKLWSRTPWSRLPDMATRDDGWELLLGHAPREWCKRVLDGLDRWWALTALSALPLIRLLLACPLPSEQRTMLVQAIAELTREELPWRGFLHGRRISDVARELLFDWELDRAVQSDATKSTLE